MLHPVPGGKVVLARLVNSTRALVALLTLLLLPVGSGLLAHPDLEPLLPLVASSTYSLPFTNPLTSP
jgi:hypothetical protein